VRRNSLRNVHANGRDLLFSYTAASQRPDASESADALCGNTKVLTCKDEDIFHEANKVDRSKVRSSFAGQVTSQIENRIANQLTWTVVGHVAAAIDFVNLDAPV
jgi:hypothetical protein